MAPKPCLGTAKPCRALTSHPTGRCDTCRHIKDAERGTTNDRGYGAEHQALRNMWRPRVETGRVICARCNEPIQPHQPWDLGHVDNDRTKYNGPEHAATCNRSAGGRKRATIF